MRPSWPATRRSSRRSRTFGEHFPPRSSAYRRHSAAVAWAPILSSCVAVVSKAPRTSSRVGLLFSLAIAVLLKGARPPEWRDADDRFDAAFFYALRWERSLAECRRVRVDEAEGNERVENGFRRAGEVVLLVRDDVIGGRD